MRFAAVLVLAMGACAAPGPEVVSMGAISG
jgi:hypothetical protein